MTSRPNPRATGAVEEPTRREALKRLGITAGAAMAAPIIIDSFVNTAGAASPSSALLCDDPSAGTVTVPANRVLYSDVAQNILAN